VGGTVVSVVKTNDDTAVIANASRIQYWHKDALGSVVAVSDGTGQVVEQMAYDAWGRRVRINGMADYAVDPTTGDRGFTAHEHLDEVQLVHMNGRVYDPLLGKFLSVDPVVGDPNDLQTYNRYSYVYNQPTRYADATGECPVCVFAFIAGAIMAQEGNKYWSIVGRITMLVAAQGMVESGLGNAEFIKSHIAAGGLESSVVASTFNVGGFGNSFLAAAGSSLAGGASPEDALRDGVFAMAFTSAGSAFSGSGQSAQLLTTHAFLGCAQSAASGGKCGPGAMSALIGKGTTLGLQEGGVTNSVAVGVATTIAGGTASVIGGGKFANGAFQAGFAYVFNNLATKLAARALLWRASRPALFAEEILAAEAGMSTGAISSSAYGSHRAFKSAFGDAGPGKQWHHLVEQHGDNIAKFGEAAIHNPRNYVLVTDELHTAINAIYSKSDPLTGQSFREYVKTLPFEEQRAIGIRVLESQSTGAAIKTWLKSVWPR
jgi:RHS repeat-associated protein